VTESLLVSRLESAVVSQEPKIVRAHVALTGGCIDDFDVKVARQSKEALQVHVHILSNGTWTGVPSSNVLDQGQRK
jgi:hypothetical protein